MQYLQFRPHPSLEAYIEAYWTALGDCTQLFSMERLPSGRINLVLNLGDEAFSSLERTWMKNEGLYLAGINTDMVENRIIGESRLYGVRFKPGAFHYFFQWGSLHERTNRIEEFDRTHFVDWKHFEPFSPAKLDRFFIQRFNKYQRSVLDIVNDIELRKGDVKIEELGKRHQISAKQLEREFKRQVGLSPKAYARLTRFNYCLSQIKQFEGKKSLLEIAYEGGYYDHAHLSNEVKKYTGRSPSSLDLSNFSKVCG